ncbi:putative tRNA pseudouridine synthase B [uncultured archaeon]|nr:putative tRNA pseudouridine synthase B [uncultured archaeon]
MKISISKIKQSKTIRELLEFGIINIDKPSGPTSFSTSEFVCKKLDLKKTSHFGTLDPKVTGVLPVALNRACKLTGFFLGEDKEYVGIMRIHEDVEMKKVQEIINKKFLGTISQKPPVKSRVKRVFRERDIEKFELLEQNEKDIMFRVICQGGTYIRKLIDDLGKEIGGAHMLELRRTRAGIFEEHNKEYPAVSLYDFEKAVDEFKEGKEEALRKMIIPADIVFEVYPSVFAIRDSMKNLFNGSPLHMDQLAKRKQSDDFEIGDKISVFSRDDFIGMYEVIKKENMFAKPLFVLHTPDWKK